MYNIYIDSYQKYRINNSNAFKYECMYMLCTYVALLACLYG